MAATHATRTDDADVNDSITHYLTLTLWKLRDYEIKEIEVRC
jgi:hypothetical protein